VRQSMSGGGVGWATRDLLILLTLGNYGTYGNSLISTN